MRPSFLPAAIAQRRQAGFTLLEILVSLMLIAIGVLGTAGLQALALKMNQGGQLRSQAVVLGIDLIERMEANNVAAIAGGYAPAAYPASFTTDCATVFCSPADLATYDLVNFRSRVQSQLPGATICVMVTGPTGTGPCVAGTAPAGTAPVGAGPYIYFVRIDWVERISKAVGTAVDTTGPSAVTSAGGGKTETFSYSITRMFQNRSLII
jgi:type IV pilus assembly protein PilV